MSAPQLVSGTSVLAICLAYSVPFASALDQRDDVGHLNGLYNLAFYYRHNAAYRISAAIHVAHAAQHDILQLAPLQDHTATDMETEAEYLNAIFNPQRTDERRYYFGPRLCAGAGQREG